MTAAFEKTVQQAVNAGEIPGCAVIASNRNDSFQYAKAFGSTSMSPTNAQPLRLDTMMWTASCTKLMTSISCMQLVERRLISLDEPLYKHIPELESFDVIKKIEKDGTPVVEKHTAPITLRRLLTHTSGLTYDNMHSKVMAWLKYHKKPSGSSGKILERYDAPLVFEPGEAWTYGPGIDYAGLLVERVTGLTLEEYMRQNLWEPLGVKDMTFSLERRPDLAARMADMSIRDGSGKLHFTPKIFQVDKEGRECQECFGGAGCYTNAEEYSKIIHGLLTSDENERILSKESLKEFFKPQLGKGSLKALNTLLRDEAFNNAVGGTPIDMKKDHGLGGLLVMENLPWDMKAGTMLWSGMPNLFWWVDPVTGICGFYGGQILPMADEKSANQNRNFRQAIYRQVSIPSHHL